MAKGVGIAVGLYCLADSCRIKIQRFPCMFSAMYMNQKRSGLCCDLMVSAASYYTSSEMKPGTSTVAVLTVVAGLPNSDELKGNYQCGDSFESMALFGLQLYRVKK